MSNNKIQTAKESSSSAQLRDLIKGFYANHAVTDFAKYAAMVKDESGTPYATEEEIKEVQQRTHEFTVVYTQPSENTEITERLTLVTAAWNRERPAGKRWYKISQTVDDALAVKRSFDSWQRFLEDKENGDRRIAKSEFNGLSTEDMKAMLAMWKAQQSK